MDTARDYKDIISGLVVLLIGVFISVYAASSLRLGSLDDMGPGTFPFGVGILIAICGAAICVPGFSRSGTLPALPLFPCFIILGSIIVFSLVVQNFGFVPAIFLQVFLSGVASSKSRLKLSLLLSIGLCIAVYLIFRAGLGLHLPIVNWPL
ncbi:hypothetical protein Q669_27935 [Labrenzia sp. C1B10]|nr:hypothetical protein Q669_27935 [Labrenzia sp. C1B10]ERS03548.1 hypothetical protein Q675_31240 [Labrenzia sp. C1B70]